MREYLANRLYDVMTDMMFATSPIDKTLFMSLLDARAIHGGHHQILEDIQRKPLTYGRIVMGSFILGRKLADATPGEKTVGVLLPNAGATLVTIFGLQAFGRVPAMLNFSTGAVNMAAACAAAQVKTIITSRRFVEAGNLEDDVSCSPSAAASSISKTFAVKWARRQALWPLRRASCRTPPCAWPSGIRIPMRPPSSSSPRARKACPRASCFLTATSRPIAIQAAARIDFTAQDIVFNAMPMFHAFGLTGGTLLPVLVGRADLPLSLAAPLQDRPRDGL